MIVPPDRKALRVERIRIAPRDLAILVAVGDEDVGQRRSPSLRAKRLQDAEAEVDSAIGRLRANVRYPPIVLKKSARRSSGLNLSNKHA